MSSAESIVRVPLLIVTLVTPLIPLAEKSVLIVLRLPPPETRLKLPPLIKTFVLA